MTTATTTRKCSKCHQEGHNARTCGKPAAKPAAKPGSPKSRKCGKCHQEGHNARTCGKAKVVAVPDDAPVVDVRHQVDEDGPEPCGHCGERNWACNTNGCRQIAILEHRYADRTQSPPPYTPPSTPPPHTAPPSTPPPTVYRDLVSKQRLVDERDAAIEYAAQLQALITRCAGLGVAPPANSALRLVHASAALHPGEPLQAAVHRAAQRAVEINRP
jgi:hypothetical protein